MNIFTFFADKPERMMLISIVFLILYIIGFAVSYIKRMKVRRLWPALALACLWFLWGLWENQSGGASIRIDLLFLLPFMFGLSIGLILCQIILLMPRSER